MFSLLNITSLYCFTVGPVVCLLADEHVEACW